jgi:hypothetical protein
MNPQNHIAHHLLTLFALNASPAEIQKGYDDNVSYQRPPEPLEQSIVEDMHKPDRFKTYLGKEKYYHDFLVFFQKEIEAKSWQNVLNEYLFANDERSNDMLARLYAGFLHPIIHLGFGIEFQQPAIIAEALAQTAAHDSWMASLFLACEKAAEANRGKDRPKKTIVQLLEEAKNNEKLRNAPHFEDGNKIRDGIMKRAPEEMIKIASQYTVEEDELEEKTAEMINAAGKSLAQFMVTLETYVSHSLLHRRRSKVTPPDQVRLLLHALRKLEHLLLQLPVLDKRLPHTSCKTPPPRMESLERHRHVRLARQSIPPPRRNHKLQADKRV